MKALVLAATLAASSTAFAASTLTEAQSSDGEGDRVGRTAAELGATIVGAALPNLLWVPFVLASQPSSTALQVLFAATLLLEPISTCTATWLVHRKMGGKGLWPAALGGTLVGLMAGGLVFGGGGALTGFRDTTQNVALSLGSGLIVVALSVFMIELHHDASVSVTAAPVPGGGVAALGGRF